jgi:hypothetical protein
MLRLYWPKETDPSLIDGSWKIPPVAVNTEVKASGSPANEPDAK